MSMTMIISPAPTANGDLHLGHIAGPFLAADVHARWLRATGREVLLATGFQDTSTYVVTTARRLGITPPELVTRSGSQIEGTLAAVGVDVDGFTGDEDEFVKTVTSFMEELHAAGRFELRSMAFPYAPERDVFLVDGFVRGGCPFCLAEGCAGLCESCGNPVAPGALIDPRSTLYPDEPVELRETQVLVLPMERYRERIRDHFAVHGASIRPHMAQAVHEMLSRPLPDYPVTYPISWGIPAPFLEVAGQVINPNAEPAAWSIYCAALSTKRRGFDLPANDALWLTEAGTRVVYFLGFDNIYPFAVGAVAMLVACGGKYTLPVDFLTNEFYELDYQKFSTSRGHAVWGRDLVDEVPRDLVRFFLALTSPENQRTNFSRSALPEVVRSRLIDPWNVVASKLEAMTRLGELPVSSRSRAAANRIVERFAACYELDWFSLTRAAETLAEQLARLAKWDVPSGQEGDFCHETEAVVRCAAPLLIDVTDERPGSNNPGTLADAMTVTATPLPHFATEV